MDKIFTELYKGFKWAVIEEEQSVYELCFQFYFDNKLRNEKTIRAQESSWFVTVLHVEFWFDECRIIC
jgi:hypothetical protein